MTPGQPASDGIWPELSYEARKNPDSMSVARLLNKLAGRYELLVVITEGWGVGKFVREGILTIRDTALPVPRDMGHAYEPLEATFHVVRQGFLHSTLAAPRKPLTELWRGSYAPPAFLEFHLADPSDPPGSLRFREWGQGYSVHEVDTLGVLRGRFGAYSEYRTPSHTAVGDLTESGAGYFCAWRMGPH